MYLFFSEALHNIRNTGPLKTGPVEMKPSGAAVGVGVSADPTFSLRVAYVHAVYSECAFYI